MVKPQIQIRGGKLYLQGHPYPSITTIGNRVYTAHAIPYLFTITATLERSRGNLRLHLYRELTHGLLHGY